MTTFAEHSQRDATFHNLFISVRRCTCFRRVFRPSTGAQNCTYSVRYLSDQYCYLLLAWLVWQISCHTVYVQFSAPDDGSKTRLKRVECLTEINKLWNVASCWLYSANVLAVHGPMNVKSMTTCFMQDLWWKEQHWEELFLYQSTSVYPSQCQPR